MLSTIWKGSIIELRISVLALVRMFSLFEDSTNLSPLLFHIYRSFSEFLKLAKQRDNYDEGKEILLLLLNLYHTILFATEAFAKVLEGMLADVDRLTDFPALKADVTLSHDTNFAFNLEKYSKYLFELLLEPLCLICEADLMVSWCFSSASF